MHGPLFNRALRIWRKNDPDIRAILTGNMPGFMRLAPTDMLKGGDVPVFCFHSVTPDDFESKLRYLAENNYRTLDSSEYLDAIRQPPAVRHRSIMLTFDDATGSFWAVAFPLLKKYGFRAVLYTIPGLVPDDCNGYPNLEDVQNNAADLHQVVGREFIQPLCTWNELRHLHHSGVVDIQSHSLTHSRIHVSPALIDFTNPQFDFDFYGNVNLPLSCDDDPVQPERRIRWGQPIYEHVSRMKGIARYYEDSRISDELVNYVATNGGIEFFHRKHWRKELIRVYAGMRKKLDLRTYYENEEELEEAIYYEIIHAKRKLEERLPGKTVDSFCYPWFEGSIISDRIAAQCGYRSVSYGLDMPRRGRQKQLPLPRIRRISDEYLRCLPGNPGRETLAGIWLGKLIRMSERSRTLSQKYISKISRL